MKCINLSLVNGVAAASSSTVTAEPTASRGWTNAARPPFIQPWASALRLPSLPPIRHELEPAPLVADRATELRGAPGQKLGPKTLDLASFDSLTDFPDDDELDDPLGYWKSLVARIASGDEHARQEFKGVYTAGVEMLLSEGGRMPLAVGSVQRLMELVIAGIEAGRIRTLADMAKCIGRARVGKPRTGQATDKPRVAGTLAKGA